MDNMEKRLKMILEANRLQSYEKWPFGIEHKCNAHSMAEAGFFWVGSLEEPDSAQCFLCNKLLDGWESTDDPWEEHRKHAKTCAFVTVGKSDEFLTLYQLNEFYSKMVKNMINQAYAQKKEI